jgi:predicted Zn-dependent protease
LFLLIGPDADITSGFDSLSVLRFTRHHEEEADQFGIELLSYAGISARGFRDFFMRNSNGRSTMNLTWISTHPVDESRIALISHDLEKEGTKRKVEFPLEQFKLTVAEAASSVPN